jgi:hypothetical protein
MKLQGKAKGAEFISAPFAFDERFYLPARFLRGFRLCIKMGTTTMIKINTPISTIPFVFPAWATSGMGVGLVFPGVAVIVAVTGEIRVGLVFPGKAVIVAVIGEIRVGLVFPGKAVIVAVTGEICVGLIFPGAAVEVATCENAGAGESAMLDNENRKKILSKTITGMRIFLSIVLFTKKGDEVSP